MTRAIRVAFVITASLAASSLLFTPRAWAVPSYTREYGVTCTGCHSMWGSLNVAGATFRLSGYRAMNGKDLTPTDKPIEMGNGLLTIPGMFPASLITGAGLEYRREARNAGGAASDDIVRLGSNLTVMDASIFLTAPLGKHLSFFIEFPMFESKAWEFTPTGRGEASDTARHATVLETESPAFEVAKFWWNNLFGDAAPRDSVNLLGGITHLPLAYPSGKVRLAVNQYLVYERRGLDLISPAGHRVEDLFTTAPGDQNERLFRLSEPQGFLEVNGMLIPSGIEGLGKKETLWFEYHVGVSNGSNANSDANTQKDLYGRLVGRWYGQSLGYFVYWSPETYNDDLRAAASITNTANPGIMSGRNLSNSTLRTGLDTTLSLVPYGVPVWLENQVMYNEDSNPTGFNKSFVWWGGFHQLNCQPSKKFIAYGRYDWISGNRYDDTGVTIGGVTGVTKAEPREWDIVAGIQYLILENFKLTGEYRHRLFEDQATTPVTAPNKASLTEDSFTFRVLTGF